jgi:exopolyphosphatase / guanosine-5'-triphosphate,3'-diphosphate pyrophosphatase
MRAAAPGRCLVTRVAVVDVGTNSVRLLVAEPGAPLAVLDQRLTITRLGASVDADGRLDDAALARTLDCIAAYADRWAELGAEQVRITATSAVRDAADRERFFDGVRERTGVSADVLTGEQEAQTTFRGVVTSIDSGDAKPPYVVLDIGGGSTEFTRGTSEPEVMTSRQLGCVRLTERCLPSDPPTSAEIRAANDVINLELDAVERLVDPARAQTLVGVAGTATTLGALRLGLDEYEPARIHGVSISVDDVVALTTWLAGMSAAERGALGPVQPGREDVIVCGALILCRAMERFGFTKVVVSEADILHGLALALLD